MASAIVQVGVTGEHRASSQKQHAEEVNVCQERDASCKAYEGAERVVGTAQAFGMAFARG